MQGKDEQEVLLQNKLHTLLFGRPDGTPTDLERCLTDDEGKVTFKVQVDCVAMHMESESSVLDAMSVGTKKALTALDVKALNEAVVSAAESESFTGIDAATYYAEVDKLPSIVSTGLVCLLPSSSVLSLCSGQVPIAPGHVTAIVLLSILPLCPNN